MAFEDLTFFLSLKMHASLSKNILSESLKRQESNNEHIQMFSNCLSHL